MKKSSFLKMAKNSNLKPDIKLLFSLVQVQNQSFGPKQNTTLTVNHPPPPTHPPPTENFLQGSRHSKRLKLNTKASLRLKNDPSPPL